MASLGALFASLGSAVMSPGAPSGVMDMAPAPPKKSKRKRGVSRGRFRGDTTTPAFMRRQHMKRRWLNGMAIPDEDREALEAAQAERERKNEKRAFGMRRTQEGMILRQYATRIPRAADGWPDQGSEEYDTWRRLGDLWDSKMPFDIVLGATAA